MNEKSENKNNDMKEDNTKIKFDNMYEMIQKIYEKFFPSQINLNNEKIQSNEVGDTIEKIDIQNDNVNKNDENLNNKNDNSNHFITPFGNNATGNQEREKSGQEKNNNNDENKNNIINNIITNNDRKTTTKKPEPPSRNPKNNNINQISNLNDEQNKSNNNNINKNNLNNIFQTQTPTTTEKEKYKKEIEKLRKDIPDLVNFFSNDKLIIALSKNNGDINKAEEYLFECLIKYQNKNK